MSQTTALLLVVTTVFAPFIGWLIFGHPTLNAEGAVVAGPYDTYIAIATMFLCGIILTAGLNGLVYLAIRERR